MADESSHIEFANRTQKTMKCLLNEKEAHSPWIAIAAFYKAVHIVEAVFSLEKKFGHSASHEERERILKTQRRFEHIFKHYSPLKRASLNARYLANCSNFDDYLSPDEVVDKLLNNHLSQVEKSAAKYLTNAEELDLIGAAVE